LQIVNAEFVPAKYVHTESSFICYLKVIVNVVVEVGVFMNPDFCHSQVTTDTSRLRRLSVFQGMILKTCTRVPISAKSCVFWLLVPSTKRVWHIDYTVFVIF